MFLQEHCGKLVSVTQVGRLIRWRLLISSSNTSFLDGWESDIQRLVPLIGWN